MKFNADGGILKRGTFSFFKGMFVKEDITRKPKGRGFVTLDMTEFDRFEALLRS